MEPLFVIKRAGARRNKIVNAVTNLHSILRAITECSSTPRLLNGRSIRQIFEASVNMFRRGSATPNHASPLQTLVLLVS